jgi:hypothetical protein
MSQSYRDIALMQHRENLILQIGEVNKLLRLIKVRLSDINPISLTHEEREIIRSIILLL